MTVFTQTPPILGCDELDRVLDTRKFTKKVKIACPSLDYILGNRGFGSRNVTCISGEAGTGKSTIALHLIASHLLAYAAEKVCFLDTTGSFDVIKLHQTILARLPSSQHTDHVVDKLLQRVTVLRVFDYDGLLEAVSELNHSIPRDVSQASEIPTVVPDSEDDMSDAEQPVANTPTEIQIGCLVIDNLTSIMNPLFKTSLEQAQTSLCSLMSKLVQVTRDFNLVSLVLNSVIETKPPSAHRNHSAIAPESMQPSRFLANTFKPALGRLFLQYIDLHLLLSTVAKAPRVSSRVHIAEVLYDRTSHRTGLWAGFNITNEAEIVNVRF